MNIWYTFRILLHIISLIKMKTTQAKIYRLTRDTLGAHEIEITNDTTFYDDLGADSLDFIELIVAIEKEFNIVIPDEQYERFKTVGSVVKYVNEQKQINVTEPQLEEVES